MGNTDLGILNWNHYRVDMLRIIGTAETPARASAGDCLPALMRQAEASCIDAHGRHEASIKAVQGAILQTVWR